MKNRFKFNKGIFLMFVGAFSLILSLSLNSYLDTDELLTLLFMVISLIIEVIGLFITIKESKRVYV